MMIIIMTMIKRRRRVPDQSPCPPINRSADYFFPPNEDSEPSLLAF
jgi:hypothetical protein